MTLGLGSDMDQTPFMLCLEIKAVLNEWLVSYKRGKLQWRLLDFVRLKKVML